VYYYINILLYYNNNLLTYYYMILLMKNANLAISAWSSENSEIPIASGARFS
jgi:hypothetical protein